MTDHTRIPYVFVPISKRLVSIIDAEDAERILVHTWSYCGGYAYRFLKKAEDGYVPQPKQKPLYLHRVIAGCPEGRDADHKKGNKLDNRRDNLRCATRSQNKANSQKIYTNNTSGYRGVYPSGPKWMAKIKVLGVDTYLGTFTDIKDAARAYDDAVIAHFGDFASLNFPESR